jgi:UDP-N-acetylglucosamine 4,6-dehydratase/5-epimerase
VLAKALLELYKASNPVKIIGTRHGEKLYETLVNREEMVKAEDLGEYYRIPADTRDLNYNGFFIEGESQISQIEEYNSHNTARLNIEETKQLLMRLDFIKEEIGQKL